MPIIIDNFHVETALPIDNRFVVGGADSFYSNRDAIQHKYQGLRIWDLTPNNSGPYYWTGVTWSSENAVGVAVDGTTSPGYLPVFTQGPTVLGKSIIFQNITTTQIGIGLVGTAIQANVPSGPSLVNGLHVDGNIRTNNYFVGSGLHVTDINATNINNGLLTVNRISHLNISILAPGLEYVLFNEGTSNSVRWRAASGLSVLNSTNTTNIDISEDPNSTNSYITFVTAISGQLPLKINSSRIQFKPDNGQLFLSDGSASLPVYSFLNNNGGTNTGMYYNGDINFSKQGNNFVSIVDNGIAVKSLLYPQISFIETTMNKNRLLWVNNNDDLLFRLDAGNGLTEKRVWHQDNLFTLKSLGDKSIETIRNLNISTTNAGTNLLIKGVYTYNSYNTQITNIAGNNTLSQNTYFSVLSFGRGDDGSVQLASNWTGGNAQGTVVADREILIRSLRDTGEAWSPWVKIWNSGNSGYVPFGAIMMWSGAIAQIPTGWRLCDGNNGTTIPILPGSVPGQPTMQSIIVPDLRERFVVGAGGDNPNVDSFKYDSFTFTNPSFTSAFIGTIYTSIATANTIANGVYNRVTTGTYYLTTSGASSTITAGQGYHVYAKTTGSLFYFIYSFTAGDYVLVSGSFIGPITSNLGLYSINSTYKQSVAQYDKNTRRIDLAGIAWTNSGYTPGDVGGFNDIRLYGTHMPSHAHTAQLRPENGQGTWAGGNPNSTTDDGTGVTNTHGGNSPHENRPPYYALAFIIYTGI
jgi:microcystin-dependent protein